MPSDDNNTTLFSINASNEFVSNKMVATTYPVTVKGQPMVIKYKYNKLGLMTEIKATGNDEQVIAEFMYNSDGQIIKEFQILLDQQSHDRGDIYILVKHEIKC